MRGVTFAEGLKKKLGYNFSDMRLLETALTHSSYANEKKGAHISNERLEFLGDAVLGQIVAEHLYGMRPALPEGEMTRLRAELVCEHSLAEMARRLSIGECLLLGKGEEQSGGRERQSILADAAEAMIAAVYLDGGRRRAKELISTHIFSMLSGGWPKNRDAKTLLQELIQKDSGSTLSYRLTDEKGPDHAKEFFSEVLINGAAMGVGSGRSKKEAEQAAAEDALIRLGEGRE